MEEGLPEENSEQAEEGRMLHTYAADPTKDRSKLKGNHRDLLTTNDRLIREIFERVANQFGDDIALSSGRENITWYLHRGIKSLYPGHPDLWEYRPRKLLVVIDYKFGFKVVTEAAANLQLRSYGVMGAENHDADHVLVAITQPRLSRDEQLTLAVYSRENIEASRKQLYGIWDACKEPDAPLNASEEACFYCKAKLLCSAYKAMITDGLAIAPATTGLTKTAREVAIGERIKQASDDQLGAMFNAVKLAGFVEDPLMDELRRRIEAGAMPGFKLGKAKQYTNVTDVGRAIEILIGAGLPKEKIMEACSISLGDDGGVREIYRDQHDCTWPEAKKAMDDLLGDVIEKTTGRAAVQKDPGAQKKLAA